MVVIKKNVEPIMKKPKFSVDGELHKKLNDYEITKLMNKSNMTLFLGRAGSGKSTQIISMLSSLFNNVFHKIILFCPPNSRASIKNDFWSALPEEQIYDELNYETLNEAYEIAKENADLGCKTLIILDDVQKNLKGESEKLLLEMANNRRHASLSIWLACQTYRSIPLQVRSGLTDLFIFKINKNEMHNIFEEQIELDEKIFKEILNLSFKNAHDFLYINSNSKRIFIKWDEVIYDNN